MLFITRRVESYENSNALDEKRQIYDWKELNFLKIINESIQSKSIWKLGEIRGLSCAHHAHHRMILCHCRSLPPFPINRARYHGVFVCVQCLLWRLCARMPFRARSPTLRNCWRPRMPRARRWIARHISQESGCQFWEMRRGWLILLLVHICILISQPHPSSSHSRQICAHRHRPAF